MRSPPLPYLSCACMTEECAIFSHELCTSPPPPNSLQVPVDRRLRSLEALLRSSSVPTLISAAALTSAGLQAELALHTLRSRPGTLDPFGDIRPIRRLKPALSSLAPQLPPLGPAGSALAVELAHNTRVGGRGRGGGGDGGGWGGGEGCGGEWGSGGWEIGGWGAEEGSGGTAGEGRRGEGGGRGAAGGVVPCKGQRGGGRHARPEKGSSHVRAPSATSSVGPGFLSSCSPPTQGYCTTPPRSSINHPPSFIMASGSRARASASQMDLLTTCMPADVDTEPSDVSMPRARHKLNAETAQSTSQVCCGVGVGTTSSASAFSKPAVPPPPCAGLPPYVLRAVNSKLSCWDGTLKAILPCYDSSACSRLSTPLLGTLCHRGENDLFSSARSASCYATNHGGTADRFQSYSRIPSISSSRTRKSHPAYL